MPVRALAGQGDEEVSVGEGPGVYGQPAHRLVEDPGSHEPGVRPFEQSAQGERVPHVGPELSVICLHPLSPAIGGSKTPDRREH